MPEKKLEKGMDLKIPIKSLSKYVKPQKGKILELHSLPVALIQQSCLGLA